MKSRPGGRTFRGGTVMNAAVSLSYLQLRRLRRDPGPSFDERRGGLDDLRLGSHLGRPRRLEHPGGEGGGESAWPPDPAVVPAGYDPLRFQWPWLGRRPLGHPGGPLDLGPSSSRGRRRTPTWPRTHSRSDSPSTRPRSGTISVAADDFAAVFVNGSLVGVVGSITDGIRPRCPVVPPHLRHRPLPGPWGEYDSDPREERPGESLRRSDANYSQNPAGVVFGGTVTLATDQATR